MVPKSAILDDLERLIHVYRRSGYVHCQVPRLSSPKLLTCFCCDRPCESAYTIWSWSS